MKTGLTLGKYSPFHKGHQYLIDIALQEIKHLIVVIYNSPETTNIPLDIRANWIKTIYPKIEVIEAWDGPTEVGNTEDIKRMHEDYLLKKLTGRRIDVFYSAEFYGEHISKALNAKNRKISRTEVNISGTEIRKNPYKYKSFLLPLVYTDYILNIVFLGAPCTGKTTLCELLAKKNNTVWMPEYGREYWEKNHVNRRLTKNQLVEIAKKHIQVEDKLIFKANKYLFTDTNAITTYMFGKYYHGDVKKELAHLAIKAEKRYDLYFLCCDDIPYDDTWDRSGEMNRAWFQFQIESDLRMRKIPYIMLRGGIEKRVNTVNSIIKKISKYDNILDHIIGE